MSPSSDALCWSSTSWLGHLTPVATSKPGTCATPVLLGMPLEKQQEIVLSFVVPVFIGMVLGYVIATSRSSAGRKRSALHKIFYRFNNLFHMIKFLALNDTTTKIKITKDDVMKPNYKETVRESGVDPEKLPKHICAIMDGNRRYGRRHYGKGSLGHLDGGKKTIEFLEWCHTEGISMVTLYAFSSENWNRPQSEVDALMALFERFVREDLRPIAFNRKIRFNHLYTDTSKIPPRLLAAVDDLRSETKDFKGSMVLNVCMSYGSRPEIVQATKRIAQDCLDGGLKPESITEEVFASKLTTAGMPEPEIMFRTSGEYRISNFLLWQVAYSEFFFAECDWPDLQKEDILDVIRQYAGGRSRRFGT